MIKLLSVCILFLAGLFFVTQKEERIKIVSVIPSVETGQDFSPWLQDDVKSLVKSHWVPANNQYIDVMLVLENPGKISKVSLYDHEGVFTSNPAEIYVQNGSQKTLIGKFDGREYDAFVDLILPEPLVAEAIVVHKYANNIPQKIRVYGQTILGAKALVSQLKSSLHDVKKKIDEQDLTSFIPGTKSPAKIPLAGHRWYQLNKVTGGLSGLHDGNLDAQVFTGWSKILPNYDSYYPLAEGEEMTIESIRFYDGMGSNTTQPMTLSIITSNWERIPIATFTGEQYNTWVGPSAANRSQFTLAQPIRGARYLVINAYNAFPNELELYGSYKAPTVKAPVPVKPVKLSGTLGVNAFEWDFVKSLESRIDETKFKAVQNFTGVRHYIDWEKLEMTEDDYTYNPTRAGGWYYDTMYERCKAEGMEVLACIKNIPKWLVDTYPLEKRGEENVPARYGADLSDPKSYIDQAQMAFQYMARYGYNKNIDPSLLSVDTHVQWYGQGVNTIKIGLGLIKYIECDNERDKWWKGRQAYQTAREYAANMSAFYDGHKNTMGPGAGVKNADPTVQVVMGGLAAPTADYVKGMIDWCKEFRGYRADGSVDVCWDVINYHNYSNNGGGSQEGNPTRGAAPEVVNTYEIAREFVELSERELKGMPVWMSEAGYDINQNSVLKAIAVGNRSILETQADWILRSSLLYARAGVEKVFYFTLDDIDVNNPTNFHSMGFLKDDLPKPAAQFLQQTNRLLGQYTYKETLHQDPIVDRYELNGQSAYALVVPDEVGRTASYSLALGNAAYADVYRPQVGKDSMSVQRVSVVNGQLQLQVTETPMFIIPKGRVVRKKNTNPQRVSLR